MNNFKYNTTNFLDKPRWHPIASQFSTAYTSSGGAAGSTFTSDLRGRDYANPYNYVFCQSSTIFQTYNYKTDGWRNLGFSATISGTVGTGGVGWVFVPSQGPSGTITSGATTTTFTLSTALPSAIEANQMANRGDGLGYIIRIVDNAAAASGKIEERRIIANTSGTTCTITVDTPFSFTPTNGSRYEFLSGALYILSTGASKEWRRHDILTGATSSALSTTNLVGTVGTSYTDLVPLDEQHVPYNRYPGEGFIISSSVTYDTSGNFSKNCLQATNTAAGTLTGHSSLGDSTVLSNQYRNFQIRIVEDTAIPTAVGQRRRINSHTAGTSPVYTLASNWTVTPSTTCKYVIENDNDKIIFLTNSTTVYNYNITANTWDTTTWAVRGTAASVGTGSFQSFGIVDTTNVARHSNIFSMRCTGTGSNPVDILDIAGGTTGAWSFFAMTPNFTTNIIGSTGQGAIYDSLSYEGKYMYFLGPLVSNAPIMIFRLDLKSKVYTPFSYISDVYIGASGDVVGNKLALSNLTEGAVSLSFLYYRKQQSTVGEYYECAIII